MDRIIEIASDDRHLGETQNLTLPLAPLPLELG